MLDKLKKIVCEANLGQCIRRGPGAGPDGDSAQRRGVRQHDA